MEIRQQVRLNQWSAMVREREDSGLSVKAFCKQAGIAPKTYYYRLRKLREAAIKQAQLGAVQPTKYQPEPVQYTQPTGYICDPAPKGATMENFKTAVGYNYCNRLFALERKWKNLNNAQREENRRNRAKKLVDEYFLWVRSVDPVSGSKLEDAVKYALNQEKYLRAFLNNGEVEISNNY